MTLSKNFTALQCCVSSRCRAKWVSGMYTHIQASQGAPCKESAGSAEDTGSNLGQEGPWRRAWQPAPVFLPGDSQDRWAWRATVHGVATSDWGEHSTYTCPLLVGFPSYLGYPRALSSSPCFTHVLISYLFYAQYQQRQLTVNDVGFVISRRRSSFGTRHQAWSLKSFCIAEF